MLTTATFSSNVNMIDDPTIPYPILVDSHHPKGYHHYHGADAIESANALLRECWSSLDDDFYLVTASLLDDGAPPSLEQNDDMSCSHEGTVGDNRTSKLDTTIAEKENAAEICALEQVQNVIASCFGGFTSHNIQPDQASFGALLSEAPPVSVALNGMVVPAPVSSYLPFHLVAPAPVPTGVDHNHMTTMTMMTPQQPQPPEQMQHEVAPFVTTSNAKRIRLEGPYHVVAETAPQDPCVITDPTGSAPAVEVRKTQAQTERRRERNRIHARRTRLRNKTVMETLNHELMDLQRENTVLKAMAQIHLDEDKSQKLLDSCDAMENLPVAAAKVCGANMLQQVVTHVKMLKDQNSLGVTDTGMIQSSSVAYNHTSNGYFVVTG